MEETTCEVPKCPEQAEARGWCRTHYQRWYRHGDPLALMRPPEDGGVYQITGPVGWIYIGSSENVRRRWKAHKAQLRRGEHHNRLLQADWDKHGESAFTFSVLEKVASKEDLIATEQQCLDAALRGRAVYNLAFDCRSPARGLIHTPEARLKMSTAILAAMTPENLQGKSSRIKGSRNPGSKLDEAGVLAICDRLTGGAHPAALAAELGVTQSTIYQIRRGRIWTHIVPPETVAAMMAVRQNPWVTGKRAVTDAQREHATAMGRANKGRRATSEERQRVSRQSRGAGNPKAKLTANQVREIRHLCAAGARNDDLAARFGVHPNSILKIKRGETWKHIT